MYLVIKDYYKHGGYFYGTAA